LSGNKHILIDEDLYWKVKEVADKKRKKLKHFVGEILERELPKFKGLEA